MFDTVLLPLIISIIGGLIVYWMTNKKLQQKSLLKQICLILFIIFIIFILFFFIMIYLPPYEIKDLAWCKNMDGSVKITGRLLKRISRRIVTDYQLNQVNIIFNKEVITPLEGIAYQLITDKEGRFEVLFPYFSIIPKKLYTIEIIYEYDSPSFRDRKKIIDFKLSDPKVCKKEKELLNYGQTGKNIKHFASKLAQYLTIDEPNDGKIITTKAYSNMRGSYQIHIVPEYQLWILAGIKDKLFVMSSINTDDDSGLWVSNKIEFPYPGKWKLFIYIANSKASSWLNNRIGKSFVSIHKGTAIVKFINVQYKKIENKRESNDFKDLDIPEIEMEIGRRNNNGEIEQKNQFNMGELFWLKIKCSTKREKIQEVQIKWDEYQKGWDTIWSSNNEELNKKEIQLSHYFTSPGYHTITSRCLTTFSESKRIIGKNIFLITVKKNE